MFAEELKEISMKLLRYADQMPTKCRPELVLASQPHNLRRAAQRQSLSTCGLVIKALRHDLVNHVTVDISQPEVATCVAVGEPFVIESK